MTDVTSYLSQQFSKQFKCKHKTVTTTTINLDEDQKSSLYFKDLLWIVIVSINDDFTIPLSLAILMAIQ
ncbi:hypothetical protein I4U23_016022 [Adineta vaga]|nr:hypothetical protein I4U23_016022 [Adineta vaga]